MAPDEKKLCPGAAKESHEELKASQVILENDFVNSKPRAHYARPGSKPPVNLSQAAKPEAFSWGLVLQML